MDRQALADYYKDNNVQPFHGVVTLDALKHLSELDGLPKEVAKDYYNQYESALLSMELSTNWKLSSLLYDRFEGSGPITIGNVVNSYTYKGVVVSAVEIEIPYFKKISDYFVEHGISKRVEHNRIVLDVIVNGVSTLQTLLNKPMNSNRFCPFQSKFFIINDRDYAFLNQFGKPYNGIEARRIPDILKDICEKKNQYSRDSQAETYLKMLVNLFSYYIDVESLQKDLREILK